MSDFVMLIVGSVVGSVMTLIVQNTQKKWREYQSKRVEMSDDAADVLKRMREGEDGGYFLDSRGFTETVVRLTYLGRSSIEIVTTPGVMVELRENDLVTDSLNSEGKERYQLTQRGKTVGFKRKHQQ